MYVYTYIYIIFKGQEPYVLQLRELPYKSVKEVEYIYFVIFRICALIITDFF